MAKKQLTTASETLDLLKNEVIPELSKKQLEKLLNTFNKDDVFVNPDFDLEGDPDPDETAIIVEVKTPFSLPFGKKTTFKSISVEVTASSVTKKCSTAFSEEEWTAFKEDAVNAIKEASANL